MFRQMPWILLAIMVAVSLFHPLMPFVLKQVLYSFSLTIKALIVALLPLVIFGLLFKATVLLSGRATPVIGLILVLVCCSNFLSTFLSHYVGAWVYGFDLLLIQPQTSDALNALWTLEIPHWIANDKAMLAGILFGLAASWFHPKKAALVAYTMEAWIGKLLGLCLYGIPLFVAGFMIKLQEEGIIGLIVQDYAVIFGLIACAQFGYIALAYLLLNHLRLSHFLNNIRSMLPAAISGLSTMSSVASMPLTLVGAESNVQNKDIVRATIPATVNIHLVGDCFAIPILAYAILKSFGMPEPSLMAYTAFAFYFVLAKFSVAAVPGGGILVMLPILESHLGFQGEMMSLITALYILFDPVITCANVLGNGAFAKAVDQLVLLMGKKTSWVQQA